VSVFRFIATRKAEHSVKTLCRVLAVSRSGFHAWERRAPSDRDLAMLGWERRSARSTPRAGRPTALAASMLRFAIAASASAASGSSG